MKNKTDKELIAEAIASLQNLKARKEEKEWESLNERVYSSADLTIEDAFNVLDTIAEELDFDDFE